MRQWRELDAALAAGINELNLTLDDPGRERLLAFLALLEQWNRAFNLSGIRDREAMVTGHLLDSLSVAPLLHGKTILDAGTGAGFPGLPLAVARPDKYFILLDSNGKKTRFLIQAIADLALGNVEVVNTRVESFQSDRQIDIVITRAFSSLRQSLLWAGHLLGPESSLLAMKGHYPEDEIGELPEGFTVTDCRVLRVPGQPGSRHVLEITRA